MRGGILFALKRAVLAFSFVAALLVILPGMAYADSDVNYVVDSGGAGDFTTIQAAVSAIQAASPASATNYTITVKAGATGRYAETVSIQQQANKNIVLKVADGETVTLQGQIRVDGVGRYDESGILETLTIDGFAIHAATGDCIASYNADSAGQCYVHNLTVKNCVFSGGASTAGIRISAGTAGEGVHIKVINCATTPGMHSLMQGTGVKYVSFQGCVLNGTRGINLLVSGTLSIADCDFSAAKYAVRLGQASGTGLTDCTVVIDNSVLKASGISAGDEGAFVTRNNAPDKITITHSELINGDTPGGVVWNNTYPAYGDSYTVTLSNNYWGPSGASASQFSGLSPQKISDIVQALGDYQIKLVYEANGGIFTSASTTTVTQLDLVKVVPQGTGQLRYLAPAFPTDVAQQGYRLEGWYTAATGGERVSMPPQAPTQGNEMIVCDTDGPLYAHWELLKPSVTVASSLYLANNVTLDKAQLLAAAKAQAFDADGNALPLDDIDLVGFSDVHFGVANDAGTPYTLTLSVTAGGVTSPAVPLTVYVMPAGIAMTSMSDPVAAGLPLPQAGFEWAQTDEGIPVLCLADSSGESTDPPTDPTPSTGDDTPLEAVAILGLVSMLALMGLLIDRRGAKIQ